VDGTLVPTDIISSIVFTSGQSGINYNVGELAAGSSGVSGYVYVDTNRNGIKDSGETGNGAALEVDLTGTDVFGKTVSLTTFTDANGFYSFSNLVSGTYTVTLASVYPYAYETANVGTVSGASDGFMAANNIMNQIALNGGNTGINYDFAIYYAGS
jgi:hypothetical protein